MRPSSPRISTLACKDSDDCVLDRSTARCEPGITGDEFRVRYVDPTCRCTSDQRCHLDWFDPVACRSDDDCWLDETPETHPIPRPRRLKGKKFRGCVHGERVPTCVEGRCTIRALTC